MIDVINLFEAVVGLKSKVSFMKIGNINLFHEIKSRTGQKIKTCDFFKIISVLPDFYLCLTMVRNKKAKIFTQTIEIIQCR